MEEKFLKKINRYKTLIELTLALLIFILLYVNGKILQEVSFFEILAAFLSFIILVEVIRMLGQYISTNHISVTLMLDMVIIFLCRDILLTISNKTFSFQDKALYVGLFLFILTFFFFFRGKSLRHSKMKEEIDLCSSCDKKGLKNEY
jgi:uncharacterized membrane protein (DUF373 family)